MTEVGCDFGTCVGELGPRGNVPTRSLVDDDMNREANDQILSENLTDDEVTKKVVGSPE